MADKTVIVEIQYDTTEAIKSVEKYTEVVEGAKVEQQRLKSELEKGTISQKDYAIAVEQSKETQSKANTERKNTIQLLGSEKGSINELQAEVKRLTTERNKLDRNTAEGRKGIQEYNTKLNDMKTALKGAQSETGKAGGMFGKLKDGLENIPGPIGGVISGMGGMLKMMWAIVANPVGLIIAAIVVAVTALYSIFKTFAPVVDKVEQLFAALAGTFTAIKEGILSVITGAKSLKEMFSGLGGSIKEAANEAMRLKKAEQDLDDMQVQLTANGAKYKRQIDELLLQSKNRTKTEKERIDLINQALAIEEKAYQEKKAIADKEVEIALGKIMNGRSLTAEEKKRLKEEGVAYAQLLQEKKAISDDEVKALAEALAKQENVLGESIAIREKAMNRQDALAEKREAEAAKRNEENAKNKEALLNAEMKLQDDLAKQVLANMDAEQKAVEELMKIEADANEKASLADEKKYQDELTRRANAIEALAALKQKELEDNAKSAEELRAIQTEQAKSEFETAMLNKQLTDEEIELLEEEHKVKLAEIDTKYNETIRANHEQMLQEAFEGMQQMIAATQGMADARVSIVSDAFSKISTINWQEVKGKADGFAQIAAASSGLTDIIVANHDKESNDLASKKAQELALVGDNKVAQEKILKKYAQKEAELKRKQAIEDKAKAAIDVFISTAVAVAKSIAASPLTVGLPWSAIIGGLGAAQIAAIIAKPIPDFNSGNTFAKGGIIGGKPHSQGGTKFIGDDGSMFEAERGEAMFVLKKDATAEIAALSQLNESKGGRSFISSGSSHLADGGEVSGVNLSQAIKDGMNGVKIVVGVESIEAGMTKYNNVKEAAVI